MKLYELPRNTWIVLKGEETPYFFEHVDGMYSLCRNTKGQVVHFAAWTEVKVLPKGVQKRLNIQSGKDK